MATLQHKIREFVEGYFHDYEEMGDEFAVFCPFHANTNTPALYINKATGLWHCFNGACAARGSFNQLLVRLGLPETEATYFGEDVSIEQIIGKLNDMEDNQVKEPTWQEALDKMTINYATELDKIQYLIDRGFHASVLQRFEIGYSAIQNRIVIPVRNVDYKLVGFIGRAIDENIKPKYKYSEGLPRGGILYNLQNAKNYNEVFVTEGSLDAIKVAQAGFPNVVSTLGSTITTQQTELLNRYFDSIVILSDNDEPGEKCKRGIMDAAPRKNLWTVTYPEGKKDPGELTEKEIRECILNKQNVLDTLFQNTQKEKINK